MITSSGVWRGTKTLVLKTIVDDGIKLAEKSGHKVCLVLIASRCIDASVSPAPLCVAMPTAQRAKICARLCPMCGAPGSDVRMRTAAKVRSAASATQPTATQAR